MINQLDLVNAKLPEELADLLAIETSYKEMSEQAASEKYKSDKVRIQATRFGFWEWGLAIRPAMSPLRGM